MHTCVYIYKGGNKKKRDLRLHGPSGWIPTQSSLAQRMQAHGLAEPHEGRGGGVTVDRASPHVRERGDDASGCGRGMLERGEPAPTVVHR